MKPTTEKKEEIKKNDSKKPAKKQVTVKLKVNIWTIVFGILLVLFFFTTTYVNARFFGCTNKN